MKRAILAAAFVLMLFGGVTRAQPATPAVDPSSFSTNVTNPYFPLPLGAVRVYEGWELDPETGEVHQNRVEETVLTETDTVMGVPVVVLQVMEYQDGELVESTRDYHAQHADGSVWYFGEEVDTIENGQVTGHEGSWLAGDGDNQPSLFMPADPKVLDTIQQEQAPGLAEDFSTVAQTGVHFTSMSGTIGANDDCIRTVDLNPLEVASEFKIYCPGPGLVREEDKTSVDELVSITLPGPATPTA